MDSVVFYAIRNKKHRYFVPYQNCSFGGVIVPKVMIDSGCNTLLLPLERGQIGLLAELFPFDSHTWRIGLSNGVGGKSAVLHIEAASISVCLSPTALPISVNALRFHLHPEDFGELLALVQAGKNVQGSEALATLGMSPSIFLTLRIFWCPKEKNSRPRWPMDPRQTFGGTKRSSNVRSSQPRLDYHGEVNQPSQLLWNAGCSKLSFL
eukprot:TRINITY_DN1610_c0_g1_i1.p1 TRINITY_DN1610_c0_g1~~TRINITY_DN1610_c0_g1_i1.p1  ORF type:complete len:208 (+),score=10.22 TRINITY_DN1610_c0_g1_i1:38-661(+)